MSPKIVLQGQVFGDLTVVGYAGSKNKRTFWHCGCTCGNICTVRKDLLLKGRKRSCGCKMATNISASLLKDPLASAKNQVFNNYRNGARNRGISFEITKEWFLEQIAKDCHYCGSPPNNIFTELNKRAGQLLYNGLDRVDNAIGYTVDNCVVCCKPCNFAKSTMAHQEFLSWLDRLVAFRGAHHE
jgi:hypothetical protein